MSIRVLCFGLNKINDLSIRDLCLEVHCLSRAFVVAGKEEKEKNVPKYTFEEPAPIQPKLIRIEGKEIISVTDLSGFAGYRCATHERFHR